jgi:hypothetical protein
MSMLSENTHPTDSVNESMLWFREFFSHFNCSLYFDVKDLCYYRFDTSDTSYFRWTRSTFATWSLRRSTMAASELSRKSKALFKPALLRVSQTHLSHPHKWALGPWIKIVSSCLGVRSFRRSVVNAILSLGQASVPSIRVGLISTVRWSNERRAQVKTLNCAQYTTGIGRL